MAWCRLLDKDFAEGGAGGALRSRYSRSMIYLRSLQPKGPKPGLQGSLFLESVRTPPDVRTEVLVGK